MLWIIVNGGEQLEGIGVTEAVTVTLRTEYKLYVSRLTWI